MSGDISGVVVSEDIDSVVRGRSCCVDGGVLSFSDSLVLVLWMVTGNYIMVQNGVDI